MRVLVTGASGFAGSMLIPRLRSEGHEVLALSRDPARIARAASPDPAVPSDGHVQLMRGDLLTGEGLAPALRAVQVGYYLVHSMRSPRSGTSCGFRNRCSPQRHTLARLQPL